MNNDILFTPKNIGSCEIKNRIVMSPMLMGFCAFDGKPSEKMLDYYEARAEGGTGLIITEITRVNDVTGAGAFAQLSLSNDGVVEKMKELPERVHKHGAKIFVQLHHPGRQNVGLLVGTVPLSINLEEKTKGIYGKLLYKLTPALGPVLLEKNIVPHSVAPSACEPAYFAGGKVRELTHDEIKGLEKDFVNAAVRAKAAGFDGVELHASHGYLLQQFFSPVTNKRTDEYGGTFENRMRFISNIIGGIRRKCGDDFPLAVRLTVDECYEYIGQPEKGYKLAEGIKIAQALEKLGIDAIDVSSAGYDTFNYWLEPVSFEPGWRKYMAEAVKKAVSIPVIAANLIRSPEQAAKQIEDGIQDFVSLGRPHIADPEWANKARDGRTIRRCICCLNCIESMEKNAFSGGHGECALNPFVGKEKAEPVRDGDDRKVFVAGAGVSGLTAAYILAKRGFDVTVFEKSDVPGGQLKLASAPPHKAKIGWATEDLTDMCEEENVSFRFGTELTRDIVDGEKPYAVFCATGSVPVKPVFGGRYRFEDLITFEDVLTGKTVCDGKRVAVIGSGMTGLETAEYLASKGCRTDIYEMAATVAPGTWMQHTDDILPRLKALGAEIHTSCPLSAIDKEEKGFKITVNGMQYETDFVVLALGSAPDNKLYENISKYCDCKVFNIGDSAKTGRIYNATSTAYNAAVSLS